MTRVLLNLLPALGMADAVLAPLGKQANLKCLVVVADIWQYVLPVNRNRTD